MSNSLRPHGLYNQWNSPGQNTGVGSLSLLQGIFQTQGSNPGLPHCRQILYQLSHKGSPRILEWVAYSFSSRSSRPKDRTQVSHIAGRFFTNWVTREVCEMSALVRQFEHSLALPFVGIGMKTDLFQFYGHCWVFQICWHIECGTFTASSFRIWNSSTGIPSLPLALFVVMLPKAHLTSHSRVSGSRRVIKPSWLSGSWRPFLCSSVYSCHLFLLSSASVRSYHFCPLLCPSLHEMFPCYL